MGNPDPDSGVAPQVRGLRLVLWQEVARIVPTETSNDPSQVQCLTVPGPSPTSRPRSSSINATVVCTLSQVHQTKKLFTVLLQALGDQVPVKQSLQGIVGQYCWTVEARGRDATHRGQDPKWSESGRSCRSLAHGRSRAVRTRCIGDQLCREVAKPYIVKTRIAGGLLSP